MPGANAGERERAVQGRERAVFLDRDGVLNPMHYDPDYGLVDSPANPDQFHLLSGVAEAICLVHELGLRAVVVSNQPGIAKGKLSLALLDAITDKLHRELADAGAALDGVYYCLHHPEAALPAYRATCDCRKPRAGLLRQASEELGLELGRSYMVGDGLTDIEAGRVAGCRTVWIGAMKCEWCQRMQSDGNLPDLVAPDLLAAIRLIATEQATLTT